MVAGSPEPGPASKTLTLLSSRAGHLHYTEIGFENFFCVATPNLLVAVPSN